MTPANVKRLLEAGSELTRIVAGKYDAQTTTLRLFDVQRDLLIVMEDLTFRPEANDGKR